jgi:hypothetical protein
MHNYYPKFKLVADLIQFLHCAALMLHVSNLEEISMGVKKNIVITQCFAIVMQRSCLVMHLVLAFPMHTSLCVLSLRLNYN